MPLLNRFNNKNFRILTFLGMAIGLVFCLSPFASSWPDGLESVAGKLGFLELGEKLPSFWAFAPMPDYKVRFITNDAVSTIASGVLGTLLCFGAPFLWWKNGSKKYTDRG